MTASMWPTVVDALITVFDGATSVDVFDGVPVNYGELLAGVAVGVDAADDDGTSGSVDQEWREAGPAPLAHRQEWGEVVCTVWAQSGDDDLASVRQTCFDLLTECIDALAPITTLGIPEVTLVNPIRRGTPVQRRTPRGVICELAFRVQYQAVFN